MRNRSSDQFVRYVTDVVAGTLLMLALVVGTGLLFAHLP